MPLNTFEVNKEIVKPPGNVDWVIDWRHRTFRYKGKLCIAGPAELSILECLLNNPGVLMTTKHILECIDSPAQLKIIDVYMCKLRTKIGEANKGYVQPLVNVWGRGWYLRNDSYPDIPDSPILPTTVGVQFPSRWTSKLKAFVKRSLKQGHIDKSKLMSDNIMSEREFNEWFS